MIKKVSYQNKIHGEFDMGELDYDLNFIREIWEEEYYFKNGFEIQKGMKVVDVGAHVGLFSVLADRLGAEVIAFEPFPAHFRLLQKNLVRNECENVVPLNFALERFTGLEQLNVQKEDVKERNLGTSYIGQTKEEFKPFDIVTLSTRDFLNMWGDKIDYLKLDCEGSEYPILYTLDTNVLKSIKYITMEFHGKPEKGRELETFLKQCGFTTYFDWSYGEQGRLQAKR